MRAAGARHGARRLRIRAAGSFDAEANAATDNPMVFADTGEIVSGGNFHGAPVSVAADVLCHRPHAARDDQRAPLRSARQPGEQRPSGVPHPPRRPAVGADDGAGDRRRAHVRAEDARTSGQRGHDPDIGQQGRSRQHEHGRGAEGRRARVELARQVSRSRLLCACQAIDLLAPLTTSAPLMRVHETMRAHVPTLERDRPPSPDIARITAMIEAGDLERACAMKVN